jgi:hypothetical protein
MKNGLPNHSRVCHRLFYSWLYFSSILILMSTQYLQGCAHSTDKESASEREIEENINNGKNLVARFCSLGANNQNTRGTVWISAKSKDHSGQFPAMVHASKPDNLDLEVTNLVGGTEAIIKIRKDQVEISLPSKNEKKVKNRDNWSGIPLTWAAALFLGQVPCPNLEDQDRPILYRSGMIEKNENGEPTSIISFEVEATNPKNPNSKEKFIYRVDSAQGFDVPSGMEWNNGKSKVRFEFFDFEKDDSGPLKWSAESDAGSVKVKWRKRELK